MEHNVIQSSEEQKRYRFWFPVAALFPFLLLLHSDTAQTINIFLKSLKKPNGNQSFFFFFWTKSCNEKWLYISLKIVSNYKSPQWYQIAERLAYVFTLKSFNLIELYIYWFVNTHTLKQHPWIVKDAFGFGCACVCVFAASKCLRYCTFAKK